MRYRFRYDFVEATSINSRGIDFLDLWDNSSNWFIRPINWIIRSIHEIWMNLKLYSENRGGGVCLLLRTQFENACSWPRGLQISNSSKKKVFAMHESLC
jgi:hypothetical protein